MQNIHTLHGFFSGKRRQLSHTVLAAGALSLTVLAGAWIYNPQHGHQPSPQRTAQGPEADGKVADAAPTDGTPLGPLVAGMAPWKRAAAAEPAPTSAPQQTAALDAKVETADAEPSSPEPSVASAEPAPHYPTVDVPLPPRRPPELKTLASRTPAPLPAPLRQAALPQQPAPAPTPAESGFFEKIFGPAQQQPAAAPPPAPMGRNARRQQQQAPVQQAMAYAPQESTGGLFGGLTSAVAPSAPAPSVAPSASSARAGAGTAVYNIAAHTVYMPDGTRLEAHSGLHEHLDNPRFVHVRMRGPTPPTVYALSPREALFHGVEALRLTPVGGDNIYGRAGLLAHTYMLGPNGDSNGCVSFRDYNAFLQAYKRGDVRRLVVVAGM